MITNEWISGTQDPKIAYEIRRKVFVEEQGCDPKRDVDCFDAQAVHLIVYVEESPAATGRIYHDGSHFRIGRLCVLKEYRGQGIGDLALRLLLFKAFTWANEVYIGAQKYAENFYTKFGFQKYGEEYLDENIPHIHMKLKKEDCVFPSKCGEVHKIE
jgi:predicted GNAT family N-acyltransferase